MVDAVDVDGSSGAGQFQNGDRPKLIRKSPEIDRHF